MNKSKKAQDNTLRLVQAYNSEEAMQTHPWEIGDVYAYQFHSKKAKKYGIYNKYILFQKIDNDEWYDGFIFSRVHIYDRIYDQLPYGITDFGQLLPLDAPLPFFEGRAIRPLNMNAVLSMVKAKEYPEKHLTYICSFTDFPRTEKHQKMFADHPWKNLEEDWLCEYISMWQSYNYILKDNNQVIFLQQHNNSVY